MRVLEGSNDTVVAAFRTRPLTGEHRYLWVDATYHKVRIYGHVVSQATVVAIGVVFLVAAMHNPRPIGAIVAT